MEEHYGAASEAHAAELAHHFAEAETVLGTEKLVHYSLAAGERALAIYAYEQAQGHFERALAAREGQPMDGDTAALLFGLGRAQGSIFPLHRLHEAVATVKRAFDYYAEVGDVARAVAVAKFPVVTLTGGNVGMTRIIARALDLLPPNSPDAGTLLAQYGRF